MKIAASVVLAAVLLTGCSNGSSADSADATSVSEPTASASTPFDQSTESDEESGTPAPPFATETPAAAVAGLAYPDSCVVTIVSVTIDQTGGESTVPGEWIIKVTERISNTYTQPFYFAEYPPSFFRQEMTYGENRYNATGYLLTDDTGPDDVLPARLMPGTSVDVGSEFGVPGDQATALRFITSPNTEFFPDLVFTDVETLAA